MWVKQVKTDTAKMITDAKNKYYTDLGKRLCDPRVRIKTYWRTLHKIINKKQAMNIPPTLLDGVFITNFQNKANLFNNIFVQKCSVLQMIVLCTIRNIRLLLGSRMYQYLRIKLLKL